MRNERIFLNENDERIWIDAYIDNDNGQKPAILVIPGGGYAGVSEWLEGGPIALAFFKRGFNAFVLNYGVGSEIDVFPKQLLDAGRAMIYIRENANTLCVDKNRVFATGFSAGGHLTGSLATMFEYPEVIAEFGDRAPMIRPTGVVLSYPVTVAFGNAHKGSFKNLFRTPYEDIPEEKLRRVSLDLCVNEKSSPMYIWHTREDATVPPEGSLRLALAAAECGLSYMLSIFPYGPHAIALGDNAYEKYPDKVQPLAAVWVDNACGWIKTLTSDDFSDI